MTQITNSLTGEIFSLLPLVMEDIGTLPKSGYNDAQKYKYRSVDDLYLKLNEALTKHKVSLIPRVVDIKFDMYSGVDRYNNPKTTHKVNVIMGYRFTAPDGSYIETSMPGEALDSSDKATAKAVSMAYKYMAMELFCIPIEGAVGDNEADNPEVPTQKEETKKPDPKLAEYLKKIAEAPDAAALTAVSTSIAAEGFDKDVRDKLLKAYTERNKQLTTKVKAK